MLIKKEFDTKYWIQWLIWKNFQWTSNTKSKEVLNKLEVITKTNMGHSEGLPKSEFLKIHPIKGIHWISYEKQHYFDSHGCPLPKLSL